jgi:hypothetical protein
MDPIHPIRPEPEQPAPIDPIRRVLRTGDDPASEQRSRRERGRPPKPAAPLVDADGHVDVRA